MLRYLTIASFLLLVVAFSTWAEIDSASTANGHSTIIETQQKNDTLKDRATDSQTNKELIDWGDIMTAVLAFLGGCVGVVVSELFINTRFTKEQRIKYYHEIVASNETFKENFINILECARFFLFLKEVHDKLGGNDNDIFSDHYSRS